MELLFKLGVWKASIKSRKVASWLVRESSFSSSTRITSNELLMIHMQLTPVLSPYSNRLAISGAVGADQFKTLGN